MIRKYFPFCFYVLVSVLFLGKPTLAYPSGILGVSLSDNVSETDTITPLKIGDKIPDKLWEMDFSVVRAGRDGLETVKLGDFRDKLIILDFWGTTCGPCIGSLNKLDSIQPLFADDVFILPVNVDDPEELTRKSMARRGWKLPSVIEDLTLKDYFPHYAIPHQAWIKDNEVYAIPPAAYATAENFRKVIDESSVSFTELATMQLDKYKPLSRYEQAEDAVIYQSTFTKRLPELVEMNYEDENRWHHVNMSIEGLFQVAYADELDGKFSYRMKWDLLASLESKLKRGRRYWTGDYEQDKKYEEWQNSHTYTYSLERQGINDRQARRIMQDDLNKLVRERYGVQGDLVAEKVKHLVIRRTNHNPLLESKGESAELSVQNAPYKIQNRSITLLPLLVRNVRADLPIKDMTGYPRNTRIDISLSSNIEGNLDMANKELKKYGLVIKIEEIVLNNLVISKIK